MKRIDLTDDELLSLQRCLNASEEPPAELAKKLFPILYAARCASSLGNRTAGSKLPPLSRSVP